MSEQNDRCDHNFDFHPAGLVIWECLRCHHFYVINSSKYFELGYVKQVDITEQIKEVQY